MASYSDQLRLYVNQEQAVQAVRDAIANGRVKFAIKQEGDAYFKLKQRRQFIFAPARLEVGFRKESADTTLVVMNGKLSYFWNNSDKTVDRLRKHMDRFADDIQHSAARYVRQ